jgi:hypothetical protein
VEQTFEQVKEAYLAALSDYLGVSADHGADSDVTRSAHDEYMKRKATYKKMQDMR